MILLGKHFTDNDVVTKSSVTFEVTEKLALITRQEASPLNLLNTDYPPIVFENLVNCKMGFSIETRRFNELQAFIEIPGDDASWPLMKQHIQNEVKNLNHHPALRCRENVNCHRDLTNFCPFDASPTATQRMLIGSWISDDFFIILTAIMQEQLDSDNLPDKEQFTLFITIKAIPQWYKDKQS